MNVPLTAALAYAARGWHVLPLRSRSKLPLLKNWPQQATADRKVITRWWKRWPEAGVGIATGSKSGLVVVDVDVKNGGDESLRDLELTYGELPETVRVLTGGGGYHLYFKLPVGRELRNSTGKLGDGLDIRATGGFVVAPPSLHPNGRCYEFKAGFGPDEVRVADLPAWLLELLERRAPDQVERAPDQTSGRIPEGRRNSTLCSFAGWLRRAGLDRETIAAVLVEINRRQCDPPLPEDEVAAIARSVSRYPPPRRRMEVAPTRPFPSQPQTLSRGRFRGYGTGGFLGVR